MKYTTLGDAIIPRIAVGTWSWGTGLLGGNVIFGNHLHETDLRPVFDRALHAGMTLWDTAPVYGMGAAESVLGNLSRSHRIMISTKFWPLALQRPHAMENSLRKSLRRLGTDHADLFWVHTPQNVRKWTEALIPLMRKHAFRFAGVSNHSLEEIREADRILRNAGLRLAAVQHHYSLLYRMPEETGILDWCRKHNVVFFAYLVLEQGALTGRYTPESPMPRRSRRGMAFPSVALHRLHGLLDALEDVGRAHRCDAAQAAIAWAVSKGVVPIVGITKPHHVTRDADAVHIRLTPEEIRRLETAADSTGVCIPGFWENPLIQMKRPRSY